MNKRELSIALVAALFAGGGTYGAVQQTPIEAVKDAQAAYYTEHGKYFQVIEYKAPAGDGYQIVYRDATGEHSTGYGVEAESRTYFRPAPVASSTR